MIFEKIREKIEDAKGWEDIDGKPRFTFRDKQMLEIAIGIVNQVGAEYNNDMVYQLAMKYALCLTQYGVDVTEKLETATQNAMALEQAYIRGRQDECDRFSEWRDRHNNGWIPCSERLPEDCSSVICSLKLKNKVMYSINALWYNRELKKWCDIETDEPFVEKFFEVTAWQPLPEPYTPKGE